jgi:hypothetical protein
MINSTRKSIFKLSDYKILKPKPYFCSFINKKDRDVLEFAGDGNNYC